MRTDLQIAWRARLRWNSGALAVVLLLSSLAALPAAAQAGAAGGPGTGAAGGSAAPAAGAAGTSSAPAPGAGAPNAPQTGPAQPPDSGGAPGLTVPPAPARLGGMPSVVPAGAYTLQQAVDMALAKNPTLLAARENLSSVRAEEIQAGVRANPYFTLYGTNVTLPAEGASNPYAYSAQVSRLFERGHKREWRLDTARATTVQTDAQLRVTEQQTVYAVRQAFTNFLIAKAALTLANDNLVDFRREIGIAHDRYQAGDLAKLDYERLDLQLAQFETDAQTAIINAQQASDQLQVLLGIDHPSTQFDIVGDVVPPALNASMAQLETAALGQRADLQAAQAAVRVSEAQLKLAYANGTADPTLEGEYDRSGTYNSAGFSINVPIRIFDRNQGNKESARYTVQSSQFTVQAVRNQVVSDVDQAYSGYVNAKLLSDRYNGHYVDEARDVLDIARFSFDHGGLALIDYLDALRDARSVTSDALNAYQQTWMAIHQLSYVTATNQAP